MAKTKKQKNCDNLNHKIDKDKELIKNWNKFGISQKKIDKAEARQTRREADLVIWEAS